jgi:hypothetical protein
LLVFAEPLCPVEHVQRSADCAAPLRPCRCRLERLGDAFVGSGDCCNVMPDLPVGLVLEYLCERRVCGDALGNARGLVDSRAHERVSEVDLGTVYLDEPGINGRLKVLRCYGPTCDHRSSSGDLTNNTALVSRGKKHQYASRVRQLGSLGGENPLQALGERQRLRQR